MDAKLQRWVQRNGWDRAAGYYQAHWQQQLRQAHDAVLAAAGLQPGERVVDIACGTGMVTLPAARAVAPHGRVVASDISRRMVDATARQAHDQAITNVDTVQRDAERLGNLATTAPFDVALCSLGLMYVPAPATALDEIVRVLRPGGRAVVAVWGERRNCGWAGIFPVVDARVESDVCPMFFALGAPGNLAGLAADAGLVEIDERRIHCDLVYDDADSALAAAFLGGPVALAYSRFNSDTKASARAEYLASIEPYHDGDVYRLPGEFVTVNARLPTLGSPAADREHLTTTTTST